MSPLALRWLCLAIPVSLAARVDISDADLETDSDDSFCGTTNNPSENVDTCPQGDFCCCLHNSSALSGCKSPVDCKAGGGECAEFIWQPTLRQVQVEYQRRVKQHHQYGDDFGPQLEVASESSIGDSCPQDKCPQGKSLSLCARNRGVFGQWGAILSMSLGSSPKMRHDAENLRVFHWSPHYPASPYKSAFKRTSVYAISPELSMPHSSCKHSHIPEGSCCLGGSPRIWPVLLEKLNLAENCPNSGERCFALSKSRIRFTFTITAPQNSENIEFRCAQMESKFLNGIRGVEQVYDLKSKHAFLGQFKDWVIYAGEMWFQPRFGADSPDIQRGMGVKFEDVMVVIDNNSGTMAPGGETTTRLGVQELLAHLFAIGTEQIQVCQCPYSMKKGMLTWSAHGDACPDNPMLYVGVGLPAHTEAQSKKQEWLQKMQYPPWSENMKLLLRYAAAGSRPSRVPGYQFGLNEARTFALPCAMFDDGSLGRDAYCWTECREACVSWTKLQPGLIFADTGISVGGGVVFARNCHVGGQRLCRAVVEA